MWLLLGLTVLSSWAQDRPAPALQEGVRLERDIVYAQPGGRKLTLDLYLPPVNAAMRAGFAAARARYRLDKAASAGASPITDVTPDDPPYLTIHCNEDGLVPANQSQLLHAVLRQAEVNSRLEIRKGEGHGFQTPEPNRLATQFFQRVLNEN